MLHRFIFHVCRKDEWEKFQEEGIYSGSSQDKEDNFIHFSTIEQIVRSAEKHRKGQDNLIILTVDPVPLGGVLKWEASRDGIMFPHLYGDLNLSAVIKVTPLNLGADCKHVFPDDLLGPQISEL